MSRIEIPKGIKPQTFFLSFLPETFEAQISDVDMSGYNGIKLTMQFDISGADGGTYSMTLIDGNKLDVKEGSMDDAMICVGLSDKVLMNGLTGSIPGFPLELILEGISNPQSIVDSLTPDEANKTIKQVSGINGKIVIETATESEQIDLSVKFNGADNPCFKVKGNLDDLLGVVRGEVNPIEGFMSGKFKIEGDLTFALQLQPLIM